MKHMQSPRRLVLFVLALISLIAIDRKIATAQSPETIIPPSSLEGEHYDGVFVGNNNTMVLLPTALPAPTTMDAYDRYGVYTSPYHMLQHATNRFQIHYQAHTPQDTTVYVDVRGSGDGKQWTSWEIDIPNGQMVEFPRSVNMIQYRARLFGSSVATPMLSSVDIQELEPKATYHIFQTAEEEIVAPTYKVYATRQGMIGGRTANGYIIEPNAWFASLPSWRALNSYGGYEYQIRITHEDKSVVVPVWDVGPWNTRDNYWAVHREQYPDIRRGWPQDHAAYFEGHNGGYAEKGYVRFPTAIDVGDGAWWALGLPDGWFEVEVTFLWLEGDTGQPIEHTPPDPNASEFEVSETLHNGYWFHPEAAVCWYHSAKGCGEGNHALWTLSTTDPAQSENKAFWQPELPREALYDVYVHVPICPNNNPITQAARYLVQHRDGAEEIVVNQVTQTGWVLLGRFPFAAGRDGFVHLTDIAGDSMHAIWFDDVKWIVVPDAEAE